MGDIHLIHVIHMIHHRMTGGERVTWIPLNVFHPDFSCILSWVFQLGWGQNGAKKVELTS